MLVRANRAEAELLTGNRIPSAPPWHWSRRALAWWCSPWGPTARSSAALCGPRRRGSPPSRVLNSAGAGDARPGTLLARLALSGFYPSSVAAALPEAVEAAAKACERWGALD